MYKHLLKLGGVSNGGMTPKKDGSRGIKAFYQLLGEDGDTRMPPVERGNVRQETLWRTEEGIEGWGGEERGGRRIQGRGRGD